MRVATTNVSRPPSNACCPKPLCPLFTGLSNRPLRIRQPPYRAMISQLWRRCCIVGSPARAGLQRLWKDAAGGRGSDRDRLAAVRKLHPEETNAARHPCGSGSAAICRGDRDARRVQHRCDAECRRAVCACRTSERGDDLAGFSWRQVNAENRHWSAEVVR